MNTHLNGVGQSLRLAITITFMAVLAALSLVPGNPQSGDSAFVWAVAKTPSTLQNGAHVVTYALLTVLWGWTLALNRASVVWTWVGAVLISITFGGVLELCQLGVPGRFGSVGDVLLNAFGALVGVPLGRRMVAPGTVAR